MTGETSYEVRGTAINHNKAGRLYNDVMQMVGTTTERLATEKETEPGFQAFSCAVKANLRPLNRGRSLCLVLSST